MSADLAIRWARPLNVGRWPRLLLLYLLIFPPAAVLAAVAFWPQWTHNPVLALGNGLLSLATLAAGVLLLDEPGQQRPALMLIGSSALLTAGWLDNWHDGPLPVISVPASPVGIVLACWAIYRYPASLREDRAGRLVFRLFLGWLAAGELTAILAGTPHWAGFPRDTWWPVLVPDYVIYQAAVKLLGIAGIVFAIAYLSLCVRRWRRSRGIVRGLAMPVAVAASVIATVTVVELVAVTAGASHTTMRHIYTFEAYLQIGLPAAFLVSVLRRRFARTRIADLLLRLRGPGRASSVTAALRAVLEDPGLQVIHQGQEAAPAAVKDCQAQAAGAGRLRLPVTDSSGEQIAVILADPSLSADDDLVRAAVAASSFALENDRLESALREQLQEVQESRLRIIEAGTAERRRLERDLHDGTQQRLLALKIMLAAAEADLGGHGAQPMIGRIRAELAQVIDELRDLAHGIHPAALSQVGLEQAIRSMAGRYTVPIDVSLPSGQFGEAAELTCYYLIAESVTNAIKHARAERITIQGTKSGGFLHITVADNGQGGACAAAGSGIRGITDRVAGVGGDLDLDSPAGTGTTIRARIPCA